MAEDKKKSESSDALGERLSNAAKTVSRLAKQAEAGFRSNWMGVDKEGKASWGSILPDPRPSAIVDRYLDKNREKPVIPGIVYSTAGIPAMLDLIHEGAAPQWAVKADKRAGEIKEAVQRKMNIGEPQGLDEHLARSGGEMLAQIPIAGRTVAQKAVLKGPEYVEKAITKGPELYELAKEEAPRLAKKLLTAPVEYFGPIVDVSTPKTALINYGVGTGFGGGLGYGIDKLSESRKPNELRELINKYGPESGTETHYISKARGGVVQKFAKGGLGEKLKGGRSAFFSAIDDAIAKLKQGKGTPEQMMSQVSKTPGVKKEELKLRDLESKLAGKSSITKEELAEVAKKNPAPVPRVIRKKGKDINSDDQVQYAISAGADEDAMKQVLGNFIDPVYSTKMGEKVITGFKFPLDLEDEVYAGKKVTPDNIGKYFDELANIGMILPEEARPFTHAWYQLNRTVEQPSLVRAKYDREGLRLEGGKDYQENLVQLPTRYEQFQKWRKEKGLTDIDEAQEQWRMETGLPVPSTHDGYLGGHWGGEATNVVGHYRTQTFTDKDGKKVLYVEEIQSDPHQKARDKRKSYIDTEIKIEKDKIIQQMKANSPDGIPPGWKVTVEPSPSTGLRNTYDVRLFDDKGELKSKDLAYDHDLELVKHRMRNRSFVKEAFDEQADKLVDKKAIASQFPENYGYKTIEDEKKLFNIEDQIRRIRDNGLEDSELATYFTPGKVVRGYGGYDKVLEFYPATVDKPWAVKVIEVDSDGMPVRGAQPRVHATSPESEVIRDLRNEASKVEDNIPDMPWKKTYDELMLKQIIDDAVQGGYDRVAISPGITQVERYTNQARQVVDKLEWKPTKQGLTVTGSKDGNTTYTALVKNGKIIGGSVDETVGHSLSDVLGKDMADKIEASPTGGILEGNDITVGGEGMKSFYDKRVPDFLRDYLKKEFGASTGRTEFEHGEGKRKKSRYDVEEDVRERFLNDQLTQEELDQLQHFEQEKFYDRVERIARANGLDPESPDVDMMAFNDEGPFEGTRELVQEYALNMLAKDIHKAQPEIRPVINAFSFDVTPEMATKVKEKGQRLFATAPIAALPMMEDESKAEETTVPSNEHSDWFSRLEYSISNETDSSGLKSPGARYAESAREPLTSKGKGYFGLLPTTSGQMATEISSTDEQGRHYPLLVPTLRNEEIQHLLQGNQPTNDIYDKAELWAESRRNKGLDPFAAPNELRAPIDVLTDKYGFAGGGKVDKLKQVLKQLGVDESKVASKDLTTLQDVHTSLGDSIRERAAKMQQQMDAMQFKYEPGQHVFTESSARKNLPPLKILRRTMVGNQPVREPHPDHPLMGKVVKDPETGKTLRTPYEPGYKVRHERGEDDWAEYDIPESAIKGAVDFAKGGLAKKIRELRQKIADESGEYNAKRLDRAADEVKNLETIYSPEALKGALSKYDNLRGLAVMGPKEFEKYASSIGKYGYDEMPFAARPEHMGNIAGLGYRINGKDVDYKTYLNYLKHLTETTGFNEVPFLEVSQYLTPNVLNIGGHDGRHRSRALADLGQSKMLVQIHPGEGLIERLNDSSKEQGIKSLKKAASKKPVITEDAAYKVPSGSTVDVKDIDPQHIVILPEIFKHGGRV